MSKEVRFALVITLAYLRNEAPASEARTELIHVIENLLGNSQQTAKAA